VSGLAITADRRLLIHNDEQSVIGVLDAGTGEVLASYRFGASPGRGDFEGVAVGVGKVWLVTSDGVLYQAELPARGTPSAVVPFTAVRTGIGALCEIEGLAFDPRHRALLVACKTPRTRALRDSVGIFRWSIDTGALAIPGQLLLSAADLARGVRGKGFHPSSIEVDPRSGQLVLITSADQGVAIATGDGKIIGSRALGRGHPQPEGLAIAVDGTIYLADEGTKGPGMVSVYRCGAE
jgi:hypothetical protein